MVEDEGRRHQISSPVVSDGRFFPPLLLDASRWVRWTSMACSMPRTTLAALLVLSVRAFRQSVYSFCLYPSPGQLRPPPASLLLRASLASMAPRNSQDISSYVEGTRVYLCDCEQFCINQKPVGSKICRVQDVFQSGALPHRRTVRDMFIVRHRSDQGWERIVRRRRNPRTLPKGDPPQWPRNGDEPAPVCTL